MESAMDVRVTLNECETHLKDKLLGMGLSEALFTKESALWTCMILKQEGKVCLNFEEGACLFFANENAAADFLYMVICHCLYLQLMNVDFGGLLGILGDSSWDRPICSTAWDQREELPYWTAVLSTNILPDPDDPQLCFEAMDSCDNELMERFSEESQLIMIFAPVAEEQRRLFHLEVPNV